MLTLTFTLKILKNIRQGGKMLTRFTVRLRVVPNCGMFKDQKTQSSKDSKIKEIKSLQLKEQQSSEDQSS